MEKILLEFVNTLDSLFKKLQEEAGSRSGVLGLTISQFQYIDAIYQLGEPTITEIATYLGITKASVTAGINNLSKRGYITKTQSPQDKRVFRVSLTQTGMRLINAKYQALKEYGEFISAALTQEEARQFQSIITKLVKVFKQT
ncbi:MarR family winged helix-turn-helix transcriptional regulator [Gloeothece verrucosa]|uniref:Transcriptional regulator, MarR family n=1 Tax=Gloeothece verrucosa (strain PCC 7822) TaxID=497965 RepID=E0ULT0_GLOV7|nr:MarR family transcriptional regulator [Gloeothece verrucosa]ADN17910.1 transcriptional regulator, MarR family [Gloeothece verrucosa PCC 7822]